jgi:Oxidoreductase family, NAD-binding Rossmann fold
MIDTRSQKATRRDVLSGALGMGAAATAGCLLPSREARAEGPKTYRIGIINAGRGNGHTWHFLQGFHSTVDFDALTRYQSREVIELYDKWLRNPQVVGVEPPFKDTRIACVYDPDAEAARQFAGVFKGAAPVYKIEKMVQQVDAVLLGDDIGDGHDHLDLIAPALEAGLPVFCDKPLADTPAGARKIIALAQKHNAPLMSSSLFRHFPEVEEMARLRQSAQAGALRWLTIGYSAACTDDFLRIYGIHPVWAVAGICGVGFEAVSLVRYQGTGLLTLTYKDRPPATVWMGGENRGTARFAKRTESFPLFGLASAGDPWHARYAKVVAGLAVSIRTMIRTRQAPFSSQELLEVVAATHAAVKSGNDKGRLVMLQEVL